MAQVVPVYERMRLHEDLAAGNAVEGTGVACELFGTTTDIVAGVYNGLSVRLSSAVADTIIFRVYDSTDTSPGDSGILLHEFSVIFDAQDDPSFAQPTSPVPFFTGLMVTAEAAADAGRTVDVRPVVLPMAGRRAA